MSFNKQDRSYFVILSEAKDLVRWAERSFAPLRMTFPMVVVNVHYRPGECIDGAVADKSAVRQ